MNTLVHLNMTIEKELELERQGMRRTRRLIGDASQVRDFRWYERKTSRLPANNQNRDDLNLLTETRSPQKEGTPLLSRIFNLASTRRKPISIKS